MFTFSVSDSFYRFNCTPDVSPIGDTSFITNCLILPCGDNEFCTKVNEHAYKMLDSNLKKVVIYSPTNDDISMHLEQLRDREVVVCHEFDGNFSDDTAFVFLSNLSRGFSYNDACRIDSFTAANIEDNRIKDVSFEEFSAFEVLPALLRYAADKKYSFIRLILLNLIQIRLQLSGTGPGRFIMVQNVSILNNIILMRLAGLSVLICATVCI